MRSFIASVLFVSIFGSCALAAQDEKEVKWTSKAQKSMLGAGILYSGTCFVECRNFEEKEFDDSDPKSVTIVGRRDNRNEIGPLLVIYANKGDSGSARNRVKIAGEAIEVPEKGRNIVLITKQKTKITVGDTVINFEIEESDFKEMSGE